MWGRGSAGQARMAWAWTDGLGSGQALLSSPGAKRTWGGREPGAGALGLPLPCAARIIGQWGHIWLLPSWAPSSIKKILKSIFHNYIGIKMNMTRAGLTIMFSWLFYPVVLKEMKMKTFSRDPNSIVGPAWAYRINQPHGGSS